MPDIKYWLYRRGIDLDRFSPRDWLNDNPNAVLIGAVSLLLLCLTLIVCHYAGGGGGSIGTGEYKVIYFDTTNNVIRIVEHKIADGMHTSPMPGTDDVFEAIIFSCGEQPQGLLVDGMTLEDLKAAGLFIGWLQKINEGPAPPDEAFMEFQDISYRHPDGTRWYTGSAPELNKLLNSPYDRCKDARPYYIR